MLNITNWKRNFNPMVPDRMPAAASASFCASISRCSFCSFRHSIMFFGSNVALPESRKEHIRAEKYLEQEKYLLVSLSCLLTRNNTCVDSLNYVGWCCSHICSYLHCICNIYPGPWLCHDDGGVISTLLNTTEGSSITQNTENCQVKVI